MLPPRYYIYDIHIHTLSREYKSHRATDAKRKAKFGKRFLYMQKHQLKCDTCFWTTSYTDANGLLNISGTNIQCPVCKKGLVKINEYDNYENEKYLCPPYLSYVLTDW